MSFGNLCTQAERLITTSARFKCVIFKWAILLDEGSVYSFGHSFRQLAKACQVSVLIRLEKGEIFWRKTLTLFIELQRTKHNSTIEYPWVAELWPYPFVLEVRINFRESLHTFYRFNFFRKLLSTFIFT